ncbi:MULTISPECIES: hypothetical protein [unclassified Pseudomonas]|uniref:hypothetical protein n=1 Tax=unclassified Pseudomonas TaxID=196821 RepID=UPI0015AEA5E3|nr:MULTISPECIES: hypothetical protein [unclassified Pseudomonas]
MAHLLVSALRHVVGYWLGQRAPGHGSRRAEGSRHECAQRPWRVAFALCTDLPELPPTELALISREGALTGLQRALVEFLRQALGESPEPTRN